MYGTSLTALPWSTWACDVQTSLDERYPGKVTIVNSGQGSMWSTWGVENLDAHLERRQNIDAYYQMYRDVAKERRLLLVDPHPAWMRILEMDKALFDRYVPDGIHPGQEGCAEVIAPAVLEALGL